MCPPKSPSMPPPMPLPPPPEIPKEVTQGELRARDNVRQRAALAGGRQANILTGGLVAPASTTKKPLLGV